MTTCRRTDSAHLRAILPVVAGIETGLWLLLIWNGILAQEPATRGLDRGLATLASTVYLFSGAPVLVLAARGRRLRPALVLAMLPIVALAALMVAFGLNDLPCRAPARRWTRDRARRRCRGQARNRGAITGTGLKLRANAS